MELDHIDKNILNLLQDDASSSLADISEKVGLSLSACSRRIKDYHETNIIDRQVVLLNPKKIGRKTEVMVEITLESQSETLITKFEQAVLDTPIITECQLISGDYDYMLKLFVKDIEDYEKIHRHILSRLPGVRCIKSIFMLRRIIKQTKITL